MWSLLFSPPTSHVPSTFSTTFSQRRFQSSFSLLFPHFLFWDSFFKIIKIHLIHQLAGPFCSINSFPKTPLSPLLLCFLFLFFVLLHYSCSYFGVLSQLCRSSGFKLKPSSTSWDSDFLSPKSSTPSWEPADFFVLLSLQKSLLLESQESLQLFTCWVGVCKLQSHNFYQRQSSCSSQDLS